MYMRFVPLVVYMLVIGAAGCASATPTALPPMTATAARTSAPATAVPTAETTSTPEPGAQRTDAKGLSQVWVPAGSFQMGTSEADANAIKARKPPTFVLRELPSEQPQHEVRLTTGYWIDRTEVTNAAFGTFVKDGGYTTPSYWSDDGWDWLQQHSGHMACTDAAAQARPQEPCVNVTWYEAEAYARWRGGRLPTEAEWEYAARGPDSRIYPWGNIFDATKTNLVPSDGLKPVGSFPDGASWVGALDMSGNAMEWVQDWLDTRYYQQKVRDDPQGPAKGTVKIEKGGWWGSNEFVGRAAYRHFEDSPDYGDEHIGFRLVSP